MLSGQAAVAAVAPCSGFLTTLAYIGYGGWDASSPTRFLEQIPEQFVAFEFEDLHAYAAEYHPAEHRMILDRTLS